MGVGLLAALLLLSVSSGPARADTPVSGSITSDTTWTAAMSPIWVEGDILVTNGATLTIDPGVEVRFDGFFDITVADGALIADGDAGGAGIIRFTSNFTFPFAGDWEGLIFNGDLGTSMLDDVVIQYARTSLTLNGASVPVSNTQILDSAWYGVWVSSSAVATYDLSFTGCTITNAGFYGMYISSQFDTNLNLQVSGCTFANYGTSALYFGSLQFANFTIAVDSSSFNASNRAVYFGGTQSADVDEGDAFRFTFSNNWLNSSFDSFGVYMPFDLFSFRETSVVIADNTFLGQNSRSYAVYLDDFWGESSDDQSWTLQVTGNTFSDMGFVGVYFDQVANYRNASLIVADNTFENTNLITMDYGVYTFWAPYYGIDMYDNTYTLSIERNTVTDLDWAGVYIPAGSTDGFRNVNVTVSGNDFQNTRTTTTLDYGVYLPQFRFDDWSLPGQFDLTVDGNIGEDLNTYAVYFSSSINGFRTVDMSIDGNTFQNTQTSWMNSGVWFSSSPSYTTSYPGSFTLHAGANTFGNLTSYSLYFASISSFSDVVVDLQGNDFSGSSYGFYLPSGVDNAETLSFFFRDNTGTDVINWALWTSGFNGLGLAQSTAEFAIAGNTITDSPNGLYLGTVSDYDVSTSVLVENNVLTDITGTGIWLGWHDRTNSRVTIQDNTITGASVGILLDAFTDQSARVTLSTNTISDVGRGIAITYAAYSSGDTTLSIVNNDIQNVGEYGIYLYEVYRAAAFIEIRDNVVTASQEAFFSAGLIYFDSGGSGWYRALADIDITNNVLDSGLHGIYFYGTFGFGATILLDVTQLTAVDTAFGITLDFPAGHAADIMNVRIADSTFRDNHRGFLFLNQPGLGLLPIDISTTQVTDFGTWGGYAFFMGANAGGIVQIDVRSSTFQAAPGALGDVYAGVGPVTMNFWYIDSITSGVANDVGQVIRSVWVVDVEVMIGKNMDTQAPAGIVVSAVDQFGYQSFISVTDDAGMVSDQTIGGIIIAYRNGSSYAGPAVQTFSARWGPFNATKAATFTGNATVRILLTADNDGDGLHDREDPDDDNDGVPDTQDQNPFTAGFLDYAAPPYSLHLWVLLGLIGAFVLTIVLKMWFGSPMQIRRPPAPPEDAPMEETRFAESPLDETPPPPLSP